MAPLIARPGYYNARCDVFVSWLALIHGHALSDIIAIR